MAISRCENILINVSKFDTSNVTNMECLFLLCRNVEQLDLSSFDTSKVTDMNGMLGCNKKNFTFKNFVLNNPRDKLGIPGTITIFCINEQKIEVY